MLNLDNQLVAAEWQNQQHEILESLETAFIRTAIDNRGVLTSTRHGKRVARQIFEIIYRYISESHSLNEVDLLTAKLAEQGLAISSGTQLMHAVGSMDWQKTGDDVLINALYRQLTNFQLLFMDRLANARELVQHKVQENSQFALQRALHNQLEEQRKLREEQEMYNVKLGDILRLSSQLALTSDESEMLGKAVNGIHKLLPVVSVSLYEYFGTSRQWNLRQTSSKQSHNNFALSSQRMLLLNQAMWEQKEMIGDEAVENGAVNKLVSMTLVVGSRTYGGLILDCGSNELADDYLILLRLFAQSLAGHWRTVRLFQETEQRSKELDILQGRYIDNIWGSESASLQASFHQNILDLNNVEDWDTDSDDQLIPLMAGQHVIGELKLPHDQAIPDEDSSFVNNLIREMGSALNNAQLLQTSQTYLNQLTAGAEVARAATTILDRDQLVQEIVERIRSRFDLYYVGLFLTDEASSRVVLVAGTGEAGQRQLEKDHQHVVGDSSMIGTAVFNGQAIVEQDVQQATAFKYNPLLPNTKAELAIPLRVRGRVIGAFTIQSDRAYAFPTESVRALQTLADQCAVAIENAKLFSQIEESLRNSNLLYQASRELTTAKTSAEIFATLTGYVRNSELADTVYILTLDPANPSFLITNALWSKSPFPDYSPTMRFNRDEFQFSDHLIQRQTIFVNDLDDSRIDPTTKALYQEANFLSTASIPLYNDEQWLGSLMLHHNQEQGIDHETLQPLQTLIDQAISILTNQRLSEQTNALYRVSNELSQAITREDGLFIAVRVITNYSGADSCFFVQVNRLKGSGEIISEFGNDQSTLDIPFPLIGDELFEKMSRSREPLLLALDDSSVSKHSKQTYLQQFDLEAALLVPALSQQEVIGFMIVGSRRGKRPFSPSNIRFAQTVVDHLTTQIENIKLLDEALNRAQELVTLNQVGASISRTLDIDTLAREIYEQTGRLVDNNNFLLARYDAESREFTPILTIINERTVQLEPQLLLPNEPLVKLLEGGEPLHIEKADTLFKKQFSPHWEFEPSTSLWIPLQNEGQTVGLIGVQSYEPHAYSENNLQLFRTIATQASLAINNAVLFAETESNVTELSQLFSISQAAASSVDMQERLQNMVNLLKDTFSGSTVEVLRVNYEEQRFESIARAGNLPPPRQYTLSNGLMGLAIAKGQPLLVNDLEPLEEFFDPARPIGSQLSVPLKLGWRIIGLLNAEAKSANAFNDKNLRLVQTLSVSFASILESGRLFQEIQGANEQLRQLDRLKTQFLANMSHELRTPLNSIIGFSRLILKGIDGPITDQQEEDVTTIYNNGQHLLMLINEILDMAKIEAGKMKLAIEPTDISAAAEVAIDAIRGTVRPNVSIRKNIPDDLPHIEADGIRIRQILINLLSNAAKYTKEGFISLSAYQEDEEYVRIIVEDSGVGIDPAHFDKLFAAFEQVDNSTTRAVGGTGLGLPITKWLITRHNGNIWLESQPGKGTIFYVQLPLKQPEDESEELNLNQSTMI